MLRRAIFPTSFVLAALGLAAVVAADDAPSSSQRTPASSLIERLQQMRDRQLGTGPAPIRNQEAQLWAEGERARGQQARSVLSEAGGDRRAAQSTTATRATGASPKSWPNTGRFQPGPSRSSRRTAMRDLQEIRPTRSAPQDEPAVDTESEPQPARVADSEDLAEGAGGRRSELQDQRAIRRDSRAASKGTVSSDRYPGLARRSVLAKVRGDRYLEKGRAEEQPADAQNTGTGSQRQGTSPDQREIVLEVDAKRGTQGVAGSRDVPTRRPADGRSLHVRQEQAEAEAPAGAARGNLDTQAGLSTPPRAARSIVRDRAPSRQASDDLTPGSSAPGTPNVLLSLDGPHLAAKAYGPKRIVVSQQAEFLVVIRNLGSAEAKDVQVTVNLPTWVDIAGTKPSRGRVQPTIKSSSGQQLQWRIDRIGANADQRLTLQLIPRESQPVDLAVRWTHVQAESHVQVAVEEPLLQMVISGASEAIYGQMKLYNLTMTNPGTGDADNVVVHLMPIGGARQPAVAHNAGTLRRGESKTIQVELSAGKAGTLLIKAHATADGGLRADASKEVLVRRASLKVGVEAPKAQYAGNMATYKLRVHNSGNAPAEEVTVTAILPPGAEVAAGAEDRRWSKQRGQIRWKVGRLAVGQAQTLDLTCRLTTPGVNRMRVAAEDNTDLAATTETKTDVIARGDLKLVVSDPQGPVPVGEEAVYELRIRNRGTKSAEAIETVVFFSEGVEAVAVQGGDHEIGSGQVLFKAIPSLAAGGEIVLQVTAKAEREGNHVFRAEVLCRTLGTKLAAQETTHFYSTDLDPASSQPKQLTAERPKHQPVGPAPIEDRYR